MRNGILLRERDRLHPDLGFFRPEFHLHLFRGPPTPFPFPIPLLIDARLITSHAFSFYSAGGERRVSLGRSKQKPPSCTPDTGPPRSPPLLHRPPPPARSSTPPEIDARRSTNVRQHHHPAAGAAAAGQRQRAHNLHGPGRRAHVYAPDARAARRSSAPKLRAEAARDHLGAPRPRGGVPRPEALLQVLAAQGNVVGRLVPGGLVGEFLPPPRLGFLSRLRGSALF